MIVLEILKWVGIILLVLLLALLCVLLLVLFLPIKYYGEGTYNQKQQYALLKVRWFWGLLRVKITFPQKPYFSVKILWFELLKDKQEETGAETSSSKEEVKLSEDAATCQTELVEEKPLYKGEEVSVKKAEESFESQKDDEQGDEEPEEPIFHKLVGIKEKIEYYIAILNEAETQGLIQHCRMRIMKILKSIRPRVMALKGTIGFASPDTTGYLYGAYCAISSHLGKNVILTPEFEREIIDVTGSLKGHITVFVLAWNALRIYFDKRLMRLISKLKKGGPQDGRKRKSD